MGVHSTGRSPRIYRQCGYHGFRIRKVIKRLQSKRLLVKQKTCSLSHQSYNQAIGLNTSELDRDLYCMSDPSFSKSTILTLTPKTNEKPQVTLQSKDPKISIVTKQIHLDAQKEKLCCQEPASGCTCCHRYGLWDCDL